MGEETLNPSPWDPKGGSALGRIDSRLGLDGLALISDYTQERDGKIVFRGHGIYTWDASRKRYTMTWFDSMSAGTPGIAYGILTGSTLVYENQSESARSRYIYDLEEEGAYRFRIESSRDGESWMNFMDARYVRH